MAEEDLNLTTEGETSQDELEGLSADSLEEKEISTETIKIGDKEVPYNEVVERYNNSFNDENWEKKNTVRSQELAEEKRRLEQDRTDFEQRRRDFETLEQLAEIITQHPNVEIILRGYTDSYGNYKYNKRLSKFRANLVKSFFVGRGISPSRIKTFGIGQNNPIGSNKTIEGRKLNRRVEIKFNINK